MLENKAARIALSMFAGFLMGCFFHYLLYRLSIPSEPFIYVAF